MMVIYNKKTSGHSHSVNSKKEYATLGKEVKEIAGFKGCFTMTKTTNPEENIEVEVIFQSGV